MKQLVSRVVGGVRGVARRLVRDAVVDAWGDIESMIAGGSRVAFRGVVTEALRAWGPTRQLPAGVAVHYPSGRDPAGGSAIMGSSGLMTPGGSYEFAIEVFRPEPPGIVLAVWGPVTIDRVLCGTLVVANHGDQFAVMPALMVGYRVTVRVKAWEW